MSVEGGVHGIEPVLRWFVRNIVDVMWYILGHRFFFGFHRYSRGAKSHHIQRNTTPTSSNRESVQRLVVFIKYLSSNGEPCS